MNTRILALSLLALMAIMPCAWAFPDRPDASAPEWETETVDLFATLPILDEGRIKPISTFAQFSLLNLSGRRTIRNTDDRRIGATEWLMDTLFFPDHAVHYPVFLVQDTAALDAIGVAHDDRGRRDRFSYVEILPGRQRLIELGQQYVQTPTRERSPLGNQIVHLASNLLFYEGLIGHFEFARRRFSIDEGSPLARLVPENRFSAILSQGLVLQVAVVAMDRGVDAMAQQLSPEDAAVFRQHLPESLVDLDADTRAAALAELEQLLHEIDIAGGRASTLKVFPPAVDDEEQWRDPGELVVMAFMSVEPMGDYLALLRQYEDMARAARDPEAFRVALAAFHDAVTDRAEARGEYDRIPLEVSFYRAAFFQRSLTFFVIAFLLVALSWMAPNLRWWRPVNLTAVSIPLILLIVGIGFRCVIRGRPPVTTLYETILFVTAVAVLVALVTEFINKQRVPISVGAALGVIGMFIANRYEVREGVDTMPSLIAVLDTNFWLATHVTTITMGYGAGFLAAAMSHIYIFGKLFRWKRNDEEFYSNLTRMVYGVLCFGLLFTLLGTVLGGVWAAESWGRFWGWDPKENGALLICLWMLTILHARKGGYIHHLGINVASVFNAIVIAFCWWGVNLLGVGLHSYGHTSGVLGSLIAFYLIQSFVVLLGVFIWFRDNGLFALAQGAVQPQPVDADGPVVE